MIRGPKPTPTALKKLRGNPGKRALPKDEPTPPALQPGDELTAPPKWLDRYAAEEWVRVTAQLVPLGLVTAIDTTALAAYCKCYSRWRKAEEALDREGVEMKAGKGGYRQQQPKVAIAQRYLVQMQSLAAEFGFTPASRTRLRVPPPAERGGDDYERYLARRKAPAAGAVPPPPAEGRA